jgi:hypothetical protein
VITNWPNMTAAWLNEVSSDDFNTKGIEVVRLVRMDALAAPSPVPPSAEGAAQAVAAAVPDPLAPLAADVVLGRVHAVAEKMNSTGEHK